MEPEAKLERAVPDPVGQSLGALAKHLGAERWVVALRHPGGWSLHRDEASHKDDLLIQVADALEGSSGAFLYESPELGHAGLRLGTSGVTDLLVLAGISPQGQVVAFFENPNRSVGEALIESDTGSALARMLTSAPAAQESVARLVELRVLAAWLPELGRLNEGEIDEGEALAVLGELCGWDPLLALKRERDSIDVSWADRTADGWNTGTTRLRKGGALDVESLGSETFDTVARLVGVRTAPNWCVGTGLRGAVVAAGCDEGLESMDVLASLLDAAARRGRDTTAARNNAMLTERARIAGVIHEGITQVLTNVAIQMEVLDQVMDDPDAARKMVQAMRAAVLEALDSLRGAILELTPNAPEWTDLAGGLERFVGDFGAQWGMTVDYEVSGTPRDVDPDVLALVFGVVQEALSNVRKHAGTDRAAVQVAFAEEAVVTTVTDEGKGFDPNQGSEAGFRQHQGLQIVRSRIRLAGGRLQIDSTPGMGTTVQLEIGT